MSGFVNDAGAREWGRVVLGAEVPVLVDFWASGCGSCHAVGSIVEEIAKERAGEVEVLKLNVDENPGIAAEYAIRPIPTPALVSTRASSREGEEAPDKGGGVGGAR